MHYCIRLSGLLVVAALLNTACAHRPRPDAPEPTAPGSSSGRSGTGSASGGNADKLLTVDQRAGLDQRISFGFDRSDLTSAAREILGAKAEILRANPSLQLRIEGHADERGSDEYNLALSSRRAAAAMRYLVHLGIDPRRLETVGYGEEQPLDPSENEAAWALNRRAEFRVNAGRVAQQ